MTSNSLSSTTATTTTSNLLCSSMNTSFSLASTMTPSTISNVNNLCSSGNSSTDPKLDHQISEHQKRLGLLRKELEYLESTNWKYESVDKLIGISK